MSDYKMLRLKLALVLVGVFVLGFLLAGMGITLYKKPPASSSKQKAINNLFENSNEANQNAGVFSAVLLGGGGVGHSGGGLTDSIIVVSVDSNNKTAKIISVPRDLWVPGNRKINADVVNVGYEGLKSTLQGITGIKIDKYASIDFGGIVKLIDGLGGITVEIPNTFTDAFYPVAGLENETCGKSAGEIADLHQKYSGFELEKRFACRYESIHFDKGPKAIDGKTALKLARSRHGDSDFGRSQRQFAILKGVVAKLSTQSPYKSIESAYETLSKIVKTDLTLSEALTLFDLYGSPEKYQIKEIQLTTANVLNESRSSGGAFILIPKAGSFNFSGIKDFIWTQ